MRESTGGPSLPRAVVVEDNPADVRLVKEGVDAAGIELDLQVINSGRRAIDRFTAVDSDAPPERPGLILLDLNLPSESGFEVLKTIRSETGFQHVPVVVVSSSRNPDDVTRVYELSGNAYVTKPVDPDDYIEMITAIIHFWLAPVSRPRTND